VFGHRCRAAGIRPSTGSAGDALDDAIYKSFFATLECELVDRHRFASRAEAQIAVFVLRAFAAPRGPRSLRTIEGFSDPSRRHSSIGHLSPAEFDAAHRADRARTDTPQPETRPGKRANSEY
jgi:putative transposase